MNRKVYALALLLVFISASLIWIKIRAGGDEISFAKEQSRYLWRVNIVMSIKGEGKRAKVRVTLPKDTERQTIYNEHFENDNLVFYVRERKISGNRIGFWRDEILENERHIDYTFSAQLKSLSYSIPEAYQFPRNDPEKFYPEELRSWLEPSAYIQSEDPLVMRHLKRVVGRERRAPVVMKKLYDFVRGEVKYKSEKGSKDASATLKALVADCGGQARLFSALSRAAGVPSRIVGGMIMKEGIKNVTHVWVENWIDGEWIPFDVVNGHYAMIPNSYLELYRGDYSMFKHTGLSKFDYFFMIHPERMPPVDNPWSLYALPVHFQALIKVILLIPVGALVVAFFRSVIGVPTFGTFSPILLALAFREISFGFGMLSLSIIVLIGWVFRSLLDHLKILVIPRLSIIITLVVIIVLAMMVIGFHFGQQKALFISFFPFAIMTWTIERFSVTQVEDGLATSIKTMLGTTLVAATAYFVMGLHNLRVYLFTFPELLLVIMAILLVLGRYTGFRFTELWRFREFREARKRAK